MKIRASQWATSVVLGIVPWFLAPALAVSDQLISLNNEGVQALTSNNAQLAIEKFEQALKIDPGYQLARDNLAIAHNNYGLQLRANPKAALKEFHQAMYLSPTNATTKSNLDGIIRIMGKDPRSFDDRVALGEESRRSGDFIGAIIEFTEALKIQDDPKLHAVLGDIYRVKDDANNAINQYKIASLEGDNADIEIKLGQAYQSKNDLANAIAAYNKALSFKSDDPDVQDALISGWEGALRADPLAPQNHIGLAQAFQWRGDFGQAKQELLQAIRLAGNSNPQVTQTAQTLLAALPAAQKQAIITKHINNGVDLQTRKNYDAAIQEYKSALQEDPNNASVYVNMGTAYQAKEDYKSAIDNYNQALKLDPANTAAQQGLKTAGAAQQDKILAQTSKTADDLFKQGRYDEAIQQYEQLLKMNPRDAATHFDLGATFQAKKDYDAAMAEYRTAASIDPTNAAYTKALDTAMDLKAAPIIDSAVKAHQNKDYENAISLYKQALELRPNNASLWFDLASAQYSFQDYSSARASYTRALELDRPGQINDLYFIATIDENSNRGIDALSEYNKYLTEAPKGTYAAAAKDRLLALSKNANATVKIKTEAQMAQIKEASDDYQKAVLCQQQQQYEQALPLYQRAISLQPQEPSYAYALGTLYQQQKDYDQAMTWYQKAKDLDPTNKDYPKVLAQAASLKADPIIDQAVQKQTSGDVAGAIELYKQAASFAPNNARLWTDLGTAYQQSDQFQQARDAYQKGYDLDNQNEVGDLYLMAAIDENFGQGAGALANYKKYLSKAPSGQYAAAAKTRVQGLTANINNVQRLTTSSDLRLSKQAQDAYDQGVKAQQQGKFDDAITAYQQAIQSMPKESAFAYALGTAYQAKGDLDNALTWYQKACELAPQNADFKKVLTAARGLQEAPLMDEAVKKHTAGDLAGAIPLYLKALALNPNDAHGWTNLAGAYQASDDFAKAREAYQKGFDLDNKGEAENLYFLGLLDENGQQGAKALQDYQRYVMAQPRGTYAVQAQSRISDLRLNPNKTQKIVTTTEQKQSSEAQGAYDTAVRLQQDNKLDEALTEYKKAIASQPNEPSFYYGIGTCYQAKGDFDQAMTNYRKATSLNPKEPSYKDALKQVAQAKAQPLVDSAIKKQTTKDAKGNYDIAGAIADYEAALRINDDASTRMNLGTAYQGNNQFPKAIDAYKRAVQLDPQQAADAYYYLGTIYETMNQSNLAIPEYQKYLKVAPNGSNAPDARSRLKTLIASGHR